MGENSSIARERTEASPPAGAMLDPVALEDRLRVARELRAEAIARRQAAARPQPPAIRPVARVAARHPVEPAASPAPTREGAPAYRAVHPIVALLALGLSASLILSRPPDAPPTQLVTAEAARPSLPASMPVVRQIAPAPEAPKAPPADVLVAAISAAAIADLPVPAELSLPAPSGNRSATPAEPPASAAEPPPPAAPRPERILVNAPSSVPPDAVDATLAALRATGFDDVSNQPTRLTIRASTVRYYNSEDAAAAAEIAALIGPTLPGGAAEARDFSDAPSRGAPGHLEIWIAGASPAASGRGAARSAPAGGPGVDPDQIRRLVEGVLASPAIGDLGRGASDVARDIESGANSVAREIDAAVNDAVRFFERRP